ncbi:hypothetical protein AN642_02715 [Epulopiscium sp. SCG-B10WGA-EpuloA2]|nr:hypothetical protein AN642_02715 [Epulopiscium sp. SCG-B10WGA-EpuloA2]
MYCKLINYTLKGLTPIEIQVEVDINTGLPGFEIVGLPDNSVKESKDRIRTAIKNSKYPFPISKITVNLAPASLKKEGSLYDLSMTVAIMCCSRTISTKKINNYLYFGELALDGSLRASKQLFPIICALTQSKELEEYSYIVPKVSKTQLDCLCSDKILYADNLTEVFEYLNDTNDNLIRSNTNHKPDFTQSFTTDFSEIYGQEFAKQALIIAACGHHNVLLIGPPGSGKTLLSRSFPALFPNLTFNEIIKLTQLYSIADLLPNNELVTNRPFRTPHHTITPQALCGGGQNPKPGEISLAHLGILFLDELLEFSKRTLEILRQPMESKEITISRANQNVTYPADFLLITSTNPCPCGYYPDRDKCTCSLPTVKNYLNKLSGPMLDRIDLHIETEPIDFSAFSSNANSLSTSEMLEKINIGLERQKYRFRDKENYFNTHMNIREINEFCVLSESVNNLLKSWLETSKSSARSYHKILKVARTIADVNDCIDIKEEHISKAIQYRSLDHSFFI